MGSKARVKNRVFKDDSRMIPARKLENRGISEKLRSRVRMYARVCFKRCRGVDKWVDDDPAAGQSEYIDAHVHTAVKENGRRGRFSGGALMRMLLIIQFVNSRYILIVLAEPRVTRITPCFMPSDFLSSVILRFSSFPRADLSLPISSLSRKMLTRGIEIRAKIDTFDIYHLEGRKVFLSLWNTFVVDIRKGYFKVCRKVEEKRRTRWADEFFLFSGSFFNRQGWSIFSSDSLKERERCTSRILTTLPAALTQLHRPSVVHCQGRGELLPRLADVALKHYGSYNGNIGKYLCSREHALRSTRSLDRNDR